MGSDGEEKCIEQLNDISFQHQFRSKKKRWENTNMGQEVFNYHKMGAVSHF